jgi:hypothetical protein
MSHPTTELTHPAAASPEEAYQNLALSVLISLVGDLQHHDPKRRKEAVMAVWVGVADLWLDVLDLDPEQRRRVEALLYELAAG